MIKAVIFDLDDTLYDMEQIRDNARRQSVMTMIERGLNCSVDEGVRKLAEINEKEVIVRFRKLVDYFDCYNEDVLKTGIEVYINSDFDGLEIYSDVVEVLERLKREGLKIVLVTQGSPEQQNKKIDYLEVREYFNHIFISGVKGKERDFLRVLEVLGIDASEILAVGDGISAEIKTGNRFGMKTARLLRGAYKNMEPEDELENPDYEIGDLREVLEIIENEKSVFGSACLTAQPFIIPKQDKRNELSRGERTGSCSSVNVTNNKKQLKVVAIGGGTGLPTIAEGLREFTDDITMVVTVTDSGRSSGMLRKELEVLPPGDVRNCLISLSNSEKLMCDLFQYRFENGSLNGHSFGNLFIAALTKLTGSFEKGVEEASRILKLKGKVLPSTFDNVHVCAELEDGNIIEEEDNIIDRHNKYVHLRPQIRRVFLKPSAQANEKVLEAISEADLIVLCPGSLFTSVITNLLVNGIADAINRSRAKKVYVCNIMTQVSQTHGFKASEHVFQIMNYLKGGLDYVVLNNGKPSENLLESYRRENAFLVENDVSEVERLGVKVIVDNLLDDVDEKKLLWEKKDLLRHNSFKMGGLLAGLV